MKEADGRTFAVPGAVLYEEEDEAARGDACEHSTAHTLAATAHPECKGSHTGVESSELLRKPSNRLEPLAESPFPRNNYAIQISSKPVEIAVLPVAHQPPSDTESVESSRPVRNSCWEHELTQTECIRRTKSGSASKTVVGRESSLPGENSVVHFAAEEGATPAYFVELQRLASSRKCARALSACESSAQSRVPSMAPGRLTSVASRISSFGENLAKRACSIGIPQLRNMPTLSNEMADILQGYSSEKMHPGNEVGPVYKMALIPVLSFLPVLLYAIPTSWGPEAKEDGSIWETWAMWPPILVSTTCLFPLWVGSWSGIEYRSKRAFFVYFGLTWGVLGSVVTLVPLWTTDLIAVPFVKLWQAAVFLVYLGVSIMRGMKPEQRKQPHLFRSAAIGLAVSMSVVVVFAFIYPLLNIVFLQTKSSLVQFGIAILFWGICSGYIMALNRVAKKERPDMHPVIAYLCVFFYNFFTSASVFSAIQSWYVFLTFLALDIGETAWLCFLATSAVSSILDTECDDLNTTDPDAAAKADDECQSNPPADLEASAAFASSMRASPCERQNVRMANKCLSVLSLAVAKLLAAIVAPIEYTGALVLLRNLNPKMNGAFTFLSQAEVDLSIMYIGIQVLFQALMLQAMRTWVLRRTGIDLWSIARGVSHSFYFEMVTCQWTAIMCYLALQWAPGGVDWRFKFTYLQPDAVWHGGLCWTLPGAAGLETCARQGAAD